MVVSLDIITIVILVRVVPIVDNTVHIGLGNGNTGCTGRCEGFQCQLRGSEAVCRSGSINLYTTDSPKGLSEMTLEPIRDVPTCSRTWSMRHRSGPKTTPRVAPTLGQRLADPCHPRSTSAWSAVVHFYRIKG